MSKKKRFRFILRDLQTSPIPQYIAKVATRLLSDGNVIKVNANKGIIQKIS